MALFKFVISEGKDTWQVEKDQSASPLLGKKIGDSFDASFLGLEGYSLKITGGTDKDGIPMMPSIEGTVKRAIILLRGKGFEGRIRGKKKKAKPHPMKGIRKKKLMRGNTISTDTTQINCAVEKKGAKPLAEILPKKEKAEKKGETKEVATPAETEKK